MKHKSFSVVIAIIAVVAVVLVGVVYLIGACNPGTPAGHVGYVTRGAVFGKTAFYGLQDGPTSSGLGWMLKVVNINITPYTYEEPFFNDSAVLSKDNLKIGFGVFVVWCVDRSRVQQFVDIFASYYNENSPDAILKCAYDNYLHAPLRAYARDEIQQLNGLEIKDKITPIGEIIFARATKLTENTPFKIISIVVGNIQYPAVVADAVAEKMATTQILERTKLEVDVEKAKAEKRVAEANGIADAMEIVQSKLTPLYLQHEAIEAQKAMVGSVNHTTVYIPTGNMGVPLTGVFDAVGAKESK